MEKVQNAKAEIENLKGAAEKAERESDYGKVAEIRYGKLQEGTGKKLLRNTLNNLQI